MRKSALAAVATAVAGLALFAAPASASAAPAPGTSGTLTLYAGNFDPAQAAVYTSIPTACTVAPFVVHAELNLTTSAFAIYSTADCTGPALTFPAEDIHSFATFAGRSFRAAR
ncbi:hypothetical protein AB0J66_17025 [Actinoplanes sp. NPDC049598]